MNSGSIDERFEADPKYKRAVKWYQMGKNMPSVTLAIAKMGVNVLGIYLCLIHCSSRVGACVVSKSTLSRALHISIRTVHRAINKLSKNGLLAVLKITGKQNVYITNPNLVWREAREGRAYFIKTFKFPANVITTSDNESLQIISKNFRYARRNSSRNFDINSVKDEQINGMDINFSSGKKQSVKKLHSKYIPVTTKDKEHKAKKSKESDRDALSKELELINKKRQERAKEDKKDKLKIEHLKILAEQKDKKLK